MRSCFWRRLSHCLCGWLRISNRTSRLMRFIVRRMRCSTWACYRAAWTSDNFVELDGYFAEWAVEEENMHLIQEFLPEGRYGKSKMAWIGENGPYEDLGNGSYRNMCAHFGHVWPHCWRIVWLRLLGSGAATERAREFAIRSGAMV